MSFDLGWLWNTLNGIVATMQSWFSSIWTVATQISNTGQGIFSGLVAFGSQIWDAILKGVDALGKWLYDTFKWFYDGLVGLAQTLGSWINTAFGWIGSALGWLAQQVYNFGNWLYNGIVFIWNWLVNSVLGLWNAITSWFAGVASAISSWWGSVISGLNTWFTNLVVGIRRKIITTIQVDITIYGGWKSAERIFHAKDWKDGAMGVMGMVASPIIGYILGRIVDAVTPSPSTETFPLIPSVGAFSYTPPTLSIVTPTERTTPSLGTPPQPVYGFTGYAGFDVVVSQKAKYTYEVRWDYGQMFTKSMRPAYVLDINNNVGQDFTAPISSSLEINP